MPATTHNYHHHNIYIHRVYQALRLEIASYQRQLQLYEDQQQSNSLASEIASSSSPSDFLQMKINGFLKSESP